VRDTPAAERELDQSYNDTNGKAQQRMRKCRNNKGPGQEDDESKVDDAAK
jgi:hypothetical protein